ncbi:MAG: YfiR family protein [Pseudomonadota bacterium]
MKIARKLLVLGAFAVTASLAAQPARPQTTAPTEQQLKAVFVFNFSHFVAWPQNSFATPSEPFAIGVLGGDAFAAELEEAVRDERVDTHPLVVRRLHSIADIADCRILYIDRSQGAGLERMLPQLQQRGLLTVSDMEGAARQGVIIELASEKSRIRLVINPDSAHDAGLTISSNLLRLAKVARTGQ